MTVMMSLVDISSIFTGERTCWTKCWKSKVARWENKNLPPLALQLNHHPALSNLMRMKHLFITIGNCVQLNHHPTHSNLMRMKHIFRWTRNANHFPILWWWNKFLDDPFIPSTQFPLLVEIVNYTNHNVQMREEQVSLHLSGLANRA